MRSFFKNSFGFNKIHPSVFIGVTIIVIVFIIMNPFKSGLSAISNVSGWSDRGTPKNKDTWNGARYYSADECAKYAIKQGNPGYTWRNNSHPDNRGKNTCVTLNSIDPRKLNNPMRDNDQHTSGCSIQNKQWPNCAFSTDDQTKLETIKQLERTIGYKKISHDYALTQFLNATSDWKKYNRAIAYDAAWKVYLNAIDNYNNAVEQLYSGN